MDSQNSATQIIEAASQMFTVHGYEKISINEICTSCNISKGKFYYYFSDKEDLFTACCAHAYSLVNEIFSLFVFDPETTLKNNLVNFFSCYQKVFNDHKFLLYILYTSHATSSFYIKEKISEISLYHRKEFFRIIKKILEFFSIDANPIDVTIAFHMSFMATFETEGFPLLGIKFDELGNNVFDYFNYYIDKTLFGVLPRDEKTKNNPKAARDV